MNKDFCVHIIQSFLKSGGRQICVCPGSRNAPLVSLIAAHPELSSFYFYEERSAAFFALGLSQRTRRPVAIITTSGTAAAELLPALMEAHYMRVPLLAITADRPRSYRGVNAPQSCEQVGLYGKYVECEWDLAAGEAIDLSLWKQTGPAHINACFDEPLKCNYSGKELILDESSNCKRQYGGSSLAPLDDFLTSVSFPLIIVGALKVEERASIKQFLLKLNLPVYLEATCGLREDKELANLRIHQSMDLWKAACENGYPIDGILRIGGIPTVRLWRDLEDLKDRLKVCSISGAPFSGLSWGNCLYVDLKSAFDDYAIELSAPKGNRSSWMEADLEYQRGLEALLEGIPFAEASLIHQLTTKISENSVVYLGNSSPIREWDLAAPYESKGFDVWATRGLSGIDGQISTFLGLCKRGVSNWAILGDLTALYDMAGLWVISQLKDISFNLVVINNQGGQIFSRMYDQPEFLNAHTLRFKSLADLWGLDYERWTEIPQDLRPSRKRLIELVPDNEASKRFWEKASKQ